MYKYLFFFLFFPLLITQAHSQQLIRAVVDEWAPFGGEKLPNQGISLDVMETVLSQAGYTVVSEIVPWERALNGVRNGTYDVIGNLFFDSELEKDLAFSQSFYQTEVHFIKQKGSDARFDDIRGLMPYSIAVGEGYLYDDDFDNAAFLNKRVVTTVVQGVRMVANGRVDLTLDSVDVINHVIHREEPELATKIEFLPKPLAQQAIHMGVRNSLPNRDKLIADFNRVLSTMRADGSLDLLLKKHQQYP